MTFRIGGFSSHQYSAYLNSFVSETGVNGHPVFSSLAVFMNRMAYFILHRFAAYPTNAYLFQKFRSHQFSQIETKAQLQVAQEIFTLFQQCSEIDSVALAQLKEVLETVEKQVAKEENPFSVDNSQEKNLAIYENRLKANMPESHIVYCSDPKVVGFMDGGTYKSAVEQLPIVCVDIFLYNPPLDTYLLVHRKNAPAKDMWWMPGGRLYKGESFFEAAKRKCWDEVKVNVVPMAQLGTYSTLFPDSEWGCQTHTINTVVLAILASESDPELDANHADYEWRSLEQPPSANDPYLNQVYQEALHRL